MVDVVEVVANEEPATGSPGELLVAPRRNEKPNPSMCDAPATHSRSNLNMYACMSSHLQCSSANCLPASAIPRARLSCPPERPSGGPMKKDMME